jgi:hypothetical protein
MAIDILAKRVQCFEEEGDDVVPSSLVAASKFLDGIEFVPSITLGPNGLIHGHWFVNDSLKLIASFKLETRLNYVWFLPARNVSGRKFYTGEMPIYDFKTVFASELHMLWYYGTNLETGLKNT